MQLKTQQKLKLKVFLQFLNKKVLWIFKHIKSGFEKKMVLEISRWQILYSLLEVDSDQM